MINGVFKELLKHQTQYSNISLREGSLYQIQQTEPNFEAYYKMPMQCERNARRFELLHDSFSADYLGKKIKGLVKVFIGLAREAV